MTTKERIGTLLDEGATVEEIAEVTNLRMRTIQTTIRMIENEEKPTEKEVLEVVEKKTNYEIVAELVDKGLGAQEIHKQTKIPITSVYTFSSQYRKTLGVPVEKKVIDQVEETKVEIDLDNKLFDEIKKLKKDNERLEMDNDELQKLNELNDELHVEIQKLNSKIQLQNKTELEVLSDLFAAKQKLKEEERKHSLLFKYMLTVAEVENAS